MKEHDRAGGYIGEALGESYKPQSMGTRRYTRGCRHAQAWIVCSGRMMWCPDCGAIRATISTGGTGLVYAWSGWVKPDGQEIACTRHSKVTAVQA